MAVHVVVPEEIITQEILIRLPIRSLVRCRCVCKLWNSLFYNLDYLSHLNGTRFLNGIKRREDEDYLIFMNNYYNSRDTPPYGLSILSHEQLSETRIVHNVPYPLSISVAHIHLVGSVNGLVCMAFYYEKCCNHQFVLWNPTIHFSKKILVPQDLSLFNSELYGFGWDSMTNDYKLIVTPSTSISQAAVYSCKTDCWCNINPDDLSIVNPSRIKLSCNRPPCVIVNGCPYWFHWTYSSILKFDAITNEFTSLKLPFSLFYYSLINLDDCLAFIDHGRSICGTEEVLYRFDEEHTIWLPMYTINNGTNLRMRSFCFTYGGEIVFRKKRHLYVYDLKSHKIKLCQHYHKCKRSLVRGFSYTPSLVVLQGMKALHL